MFKGLKAEDFYAISQREMTPEGYLRAPNSTLARTGVQNYRAHELGLDSASGVDPMKLIRLHRPAEEVFNPESMASFENQAMTDNHPPEGVTSENWKDHAVGEARDIRREGRELKGTTIIKDKSAVDRALAGKVQLSNGYTFDLDLTPGTNENGEAYDGIQRNIRGNHIALVDSARCGSACRISDADPEHNKEIPMTTETLRRLIVDSIPIDVTDAVAAVIEKLQGTTRTAVKRALDAEANVTKLTTDHAAALAAKDAEIANLKKDVMTPAARDAMVADWAKLLNDAKALFPAIATDGKTCAVIRREVLTEITGKDSRVKALVDAVLTGKTIADASEDSLRSAINAVIAAKTGLDGNVVSLNAADTVLANALIGGGTQGTAAQDGKLTGRDAFVQRQRDAWRGDQAKK